MDSIFQSMVYLPFCYTAFPGNNPFFSDIPGPISPKMNKIKDFPGILGSSREYSGFLRISGISRESGFDAKLGFFLILRIICRGFGVGKG
jgi:hypothetical protein